MRAYKESSDLEVNELFTKLSARNVPLSKSDLRKARSTLTALQKKQSGSLREGTDRK